MYARLADAAHLLHGLFLIDDFEALTMQWCPALPAQMQGLLMMVWPLTLISSYLSSISIFRKLVGSRSYHVITNCRGVYLDNDELLVRSIIQDLQP
jgi:hypothetical protein